MMVTGNEGGVSVTGAIHGVLFLAYALLVLRDREVFAWSWGFVAVAILTGPIGAIVVLERLRRR
jgi:heme A synthase